MNYVEKVYCTQAFDMNSCHPQGTKLNNYKEIFESLFEEIFKSTKKSSNSSQGSSKIGRNRDDQIG